MKKMKRMLAGAVCTAMLAGLGSAVPVRAIELPHALIGYEYDTSRDLAYYQALTDAQVYAEFN